MKWTAEMKAEAAKLWASGMAGPDIARAVGVTAKALYAMAGVNVAFAPRGRGNPRPSVNADAAPLPAKPVKARFPAKAPGYDGVPHGRLTSCQCQFPLWGDHERVDPARSLVCGAPRSQGGRHPYCTFHAIATAGRGTTGERRAIRDAITVDTREAVAA